MQTKAQVTLFMIIGAVVLIAASILFFIRNQSAEQDILTETPGAVQYAGQQELRTFMDSCIRDAAFQGMEILRLQGGYIDIPADAATIELQQDERIFDSNGIKKVEPYPGAKNDVVYWLDSSNNLHVPTVFSVEQELSAYVKKSVLSCINDFSAFREQNYQISTGIMDVNIELSDETSINVDYPLTVTKGDISFEEGLFTLHVPINLKKALDISKELTLSEYYGAYLEYDLTNLLSLYGYAGKDTPYDLPPMIFTEANSDCKMQTWTLSGTKELLLNNFEANLPYISIAGYGDNRGEETNDIAKGVYDSMTHDVASGYPDAEVDFSLDRSQDFSLDVKPKLGDLLRPDVYRTTGIKLLPVFCNVEYKFKYTVKFPAIMTVTDDASPAIDILGKTVDKSRKFVMSIPLGVLICGNQARQCTGKPAYLTPGVDTAGLGFEVPVTTMLCDPDNKKSQPMKITALDKNSLSPVPDATIMYGCGSEECLVGVTDDQGEITDSLPLCVNGQLRVIKEDYSKSFQSLTTDKGTDTLLLSYTIEPLKEFNVLVQTIELPAFMELYHLSNGFTQQVCGQSVTVENAAKSGNFDISLSSTYGPSDAALSYPTSQKIKLASGSYSFDTFVSGSAHVISPTVQGQTFNLNNVQFWMYGSYAFTWDFTDAMIQQNKMIHFHVPVDTVASTIDPLNIPHVVQDDGSLLYTLPVDDDCNPSTPRKTVTVSVTQDKFNQLMAPRFS